MLCSKCNVELNKQEILDKCTKKEGNNYIADIRVIYTCNSCKRSILEFKKQVTEINI